MRLSIVLAIPLCGCVSPSEGMGQTVASYTLGGQLERPAGPPVIVFLGLVSPGKLITDPSIQQGPVARIVAEEYQPKPGDPSQPPTLSRTLTMDFDEQGRDVGEIERHGLSETSSVLSYQDGHIVEIDTSFQL